MTQESRTTRSARIRGELAVPLEKEKEVKSANHLFAYQEIIGKNLEASLTELLQTILAGAVNLNASDIHFEPQEDRVRLRVRVDGVLQDILDLETNVYKKILSRIKLLAGLKLNISDRPQDGRFSILMQGRGLEVEIRTSALPAEYGESVVMRILNPESLKDLEQLGLRKDLLEKVREEIKKPNGMIIATGPTGCGKTTTLYAFCKKLSSPEIKIITIEDPIEYHLEGLSQTQVDPKKGYDFASGLRSIVRQDPDVILVGEVRDQQTVDIALQAALTGHLVLTTLHTNDAAGVVARLISLEGKVANIGPALNMVVGQRLARKVCSDCKKMRKPNAEELTEIKEQVSALPDSLKEYKKQKIEKIAQAVGCEKCNKTGYRGRTGIFELFLMDEEIEELIQEKPSIAKLRRVARGKGMTTMKQDGILKVLKGETTLEEVKRIAG